MSEEEEVHVPRPFTPPRTSAGWHQPKAPDATKTQEAIQRHLLALGELVAGIPGQRVVLTDEFMARLFVGHAALHVTSDPMRMQVVLSAQGGELLQGGAEVVGDVLASSSTV